MTRIALFPGQGAQTPGMGKALFDRYPEARAVFEAVDAALGEKLSQIIFEGPAEELTRTANAQPALMACSLAAVRSFEAATGKDLTEWVDHVAGHSLGEYSALAAAGSLEIADAARLLRLRGSAMQAAVPVGQGAMAAIMGLGADAIEAMLAAMDAGTGGVCVLANDNSDGQAVLSGTRAAVEEASLLAREKGAKRAIMLDVSAPFHCPLMQPAADALAPALKAAPLKAPAVPLIANVTASPQSDPDAIRELLIAQVTARVRWRESMAKMQELGVDGVIEFGAGKVLTGMARRVLKEASMINIQGPEDIEAFLAAQS
jgi:[acyl-carrier-protein] S-malonyltransferase